MPRHRTVHRSRLDPRPHRRYRRDRCDLPAIYITNQGATAAGELRANAAITGLGTGDTFDVFSDTGSVDVLIDAVGTFDTAT